MHDCLEYVRGSACEFDFSASLFKLIKLQLKKSGSGRGNMVEEPGSKQTAALRENKFAEVFQLFFLTNVCSFKIHSLR